MTTRRSILKTLPAGGLLALGTPAAAKAAIPSDADSLSSELRDPIERYMEDHATLNRYFTARRSPARRARMKRFHSDWTARLERIDFDPLSQDARVDYILFRNHLNHALRQIDLDEKADAETAPLIPFSAAILSLEDARLRMEPIDSAKTAAALADLKKQIGTTQKQVEAQMKGPRKPVKAVANSAAGETDDLRKTLEHWFGFYNGYDPVFTWWAAEPYKELDKALGEYASFLRETVVGMKPDDKTTIIGRPIGREALLADIAYQMIPYTPEQLIELANRELAWCEAQMKRASNEMGSGDDWRKALEKVKTMHVEPGKQPAMIRDLALEAIAFVEKRDLVTIPPLAKDSWRMEMMTPRQQLVNPFFTGGERLTVSYPTDTMTEEQKLMSMRGNNIPFSRATVFHEVIPGHHLQLFMADRYRPYRQLFDTPFLVEGWALYWELYFWDLGFGQTPEERVGMLFWRSHRCARIIFSLGFHLGQMTPEQCIDLLVDRIGHERENAAAEVRRSFNGSYSPLYQCAYLLGGLQIRALHREIVGSGKMTNRAFHDAVLKENSIPIEMIRAGLRNERLSRDYSSNWKFYDAF